MDKFEIPKKRTSEIVSQYFINCIIMFLVCLILGYLLGGLNGCFIVGIFGFLNFGGYNIFQYYLCRLFLRSTGRFIYNSDPFLDWCAERVLVQRVGGGWRFIHRSLQEHFAERYYEKHPGERPKVTAIGATQDKIETK